MHISRDTHRGPGSDPPVILAVDPTAVNLRENQAQTICGGPAAAPANLPIAMLSSLVVQERIDHAILIR
jgi:hypothetical protein